MTILLKVALPTTTIASYVRTPLITLTLSAAFLCHCNEAVHVNLVINVYDDDDDDDDDDDVIRYDSVYLTCSKKLEG